MVLKKHLNFLQIVNNQDHRWLTTAHAAHPPCPFLEISLIPLTLKCFLSILKKDARNQPTDILLYSGT